MIVNNICCMEMIGKPNKIGISGVSIGISPVNIFGEYHLKFISTATITVAGTASFIGIRRLWKKEEVIYT